MLPCAGMQQLSQRCAVLLQGKSQTAVQLKSAAAIDARHRPNLDAIVMH